MVVGRAGQRGVAVQPVFARETSVFERELAPIPYQVKMESIAMKETVQNKETAWVSSIGSCSILLLD